LSAPALAPDKLGVGAGMVLVYVVVQMVVSVPLSIAGMFVAAPLLGVSYGTVGLAILKLAAITALTNGIAITAELLGAPPVGYVIGLGASWFLFGQFFQLEFQETLVSLIIIGMVKWVVGMFVAMALLKHMN